MIEISKLWLVIPAFIIGPTIVGLFVGVMIQILLFFGEDKQWKYTLAFGVIITWIAFLIASDIIKFV